MKKIEIYDGSDADITGKLAYELCDKDQKFNRYDLKNKYSKIYNF